ncbi:aspartate/glutamate racemase family protein [Roseomonas cutis]|uniref:aspartate/glutamate racemase family protein n=1 Tax=Roseomonas cutis TaxID=2897332 RepID=UPI00272C514A|nr:aspartate/glutamate racemase family protein [Roseomonas sp. OT10]
MRGARRSLHPAAAMRLLLLNGNTDTGVTERLARHARARLDATGRAAVALRPATARFGARYISSRAAVAVAGHAVLDAIAAQAGTVDAVAIACFGEPGLLAAREVAGVPVRGMAEASIEAGLALAPRIALLTGGAAWVPMLHELVFSLGLPAERIDIRSVTPTGDMIARDPDGALALLAAEARTAAAAGAGAIILGGAGLVGLAPRLAERTGLPALDSLDCLLDAALRPPRGTPPATVGGTPSIGLAPALERLLAG